MYTKYFPMQNLEEIYRTIKQSSKKNANVSSFGEDMGKLSVFIKRVLLPKVLKIGSRIQDKSEILNFTHCLNN